MSTDTETGRVFTKTGRALKKNDKKKLSGL